MILWTHHFNDGDTCEYSSHHEYGFVVPVGIEMEDFCEDDIKRTDEIAKAEIAFQEALSFLDDDQAMTLFGDHCEVTIYKDSIEVEEYCHD